MPVKNAIAKNWASWVRGSDGYLRSDDPYGLYGRVPSITSLPVGSSTTGDWNSFPGTAMVINTPFTDTTTAVLRRVTNATYPTAANAQAFLDYASGATRISLVHADGATYWITACTGNTVYAAKYTKGIGIDSSTWRALPVCFAGNLQYTFSRLSGEQHIVYLAVNGGTKIRRYNVNTQAYETTAVFTGANAEISAGGGSPGWLQGSWDGTRLTWMTPYAAAAAFTFTANAGTDVVTNNSVATGCRVQCTSTGTLPAGLSLATNYWMIDINGVTGKLASSLANALAGTPVDITGVGTGTHTMTPCYDLQHLDVSSGTLITYNAAPTANINEIRMTKGSARTVEVSSNTDLVQYWFVDSGKMTATGASSRSGHCDTGESSFYAFDPNTANYPLAVQTSGTAPASDGGAYNGSRTDVFNGGSGTQLNDDDTHGSMAWNQTGAGTAEWYCFDAGDLTPITRVDANAWSIDSGAVYKTTVTFNVPLYGGDTRGVTSVLLWNGTTGSGSVIQGKLTLAASRLAMTAGTFFWNGTTLYVWMSDGTTPSGKVIIKNSSLLAESLGYAKQDGSSSRRLCYMYRETQDTTYSRRSFANWSPDGKIAMFASNLGTYSGRCDVIVAEVPLT